MTRPVAALPSLPTSFAAQLAVHPHLLHTAGRTRRQTTDRNDEPPTMAEVGRKRAQDGDSTANVRKKLRPSELPLSQAKRSAIDSLVHMFRKKGTYDDIRRDLMKQYVSGVCENLAFKSLG